MNYKEKQKLLVKINELSLLMADSISKYFDDCDNSLLINRANRLCESLIKFLNSS